MELELCGNPQPTLSFTFRGKTEAAEMIEKVDDTKKMYKYKINLDNIVREDCGSTLTLNAFGFKNWYNSSTIKIECKNSQNLLYLHSYVTCYVQILIRLLQTYSWLAGRFQLFWKISINISDKIFSAIKIYQSHFLENFKISIRKRIRTAIQVCVLNWWTNQSVYL